MSKKTNTLLFVLLGTLFNILITIFCFVGFLLIYTRFLNPRLPESGGAWALPVIFVVSIAASFFVYRFAVKIITKKVDMEKHFDPIFGPKRPSGKS